jgi:hypothetical protein
MSENKLLRRIFGPRRDAATGTGENYIMKNSVLCTLHQIIIG